jgi:predicted DNA-binding protein
MTAIMIQLPDSLRQRAEQIAMQRGAAIDDLLQELLEEYLEEIDDVREATDIRSRIASQA